MAIFRQIIDLLFLVYTVMLIARVIGSWFPDWSGHALFRFIAHYTDPYLNLFRKIIPPIGIIDISPLFAFIALSVARWFIVGILLR